MGARSPLLGRAWLLVWITAGLSTSLLVSLLVACSPHLNAPVSALTPAPIETTWHPIVPPTQDSVPSYAISQDVPGLIIACMGSTSEQSDRTHFGPAHLWRSRDEGAHWQQLSAPIPLSAGCAVTLLAGGKGAAAIYDYESDTLIVSPDAGESWRIVKQLLPHEIAANRFTSLQQAIYRDGRLYASLIFNEVIARVFSVSDDTGLTWTELQQTPTPAAGDQPVMTEQFTPDYRVSNAWFRYSLHAHNNGALPSFTSVDHSSDNGRTWQEVSKLDFEGAMPPQNGRSLVSRPEQPSRLCEGLIILVSVQGFRFPRFDLVLGQSEDAGRTWRYIRVTRVSQHRLFEGDPAVQMDAAGRCYTAISPINDGTNRTHPTNATLLCWLSGTTTQPSVIASFRLQVIQTFAVFPLASGTGIHLLISASAILPPVNQTITDGVTMLFWTTTPG
jgi:hypothetical protein